MSSEIPGGPPRDRKVGELILDVSDRISTLVQEEIELAKTEVTEKVNSLTRGSAIGIAAGIFAVLGLAMLMHAIAWLLNELFFEDAVYIGFAIEALFWFIVAAIAGLLARNSIQAGSPPMPEQAIEEAKRARQTIASGTTPAAKEPVMSDVVTGESASTDPLSREP